MFKQHSSRHLASTKASAMSLTALDQSVDQAERTYHTFRVKLKSLISTLKTHHEAMLALNRSQMQTTTAICDFVINTPLSKCAIGKSNDNEHTVVLRYKHNEQENDDQQNDCRVGSTSSKDENESEIESSNEVKTDSSKETKTGTPKESRVESSTDEFTESKSNKPWSAGSTHPFESAIDHGKNLDNVGNSFVDVFNATNDLNLVYAKIYMEWVIGYLLKLEEIISTRIEGKLFQFGQMRQAYAHYTEKVHGLDKKVGGKKKGTNSRLEDKLDRNRLKLSSTEEAHNEFGKGLLSLMEEVTVHYFKDFIPLLHMTIKLSINHSSDVAAVMKKLEEADASLKEVCEEHGIGITGRLESLRPEPTENAKMVEEAPLEEEMISEDKKDADTAA